MDKIIKALAYDNMVRIYAIDATILTEELRARHDLHKTSLAALGRTAASTLLTASLYEKNVNIDVLIDGKGPIGKINATANSNGYCYAYLENPHVYINKENNHLDVGKAVGKNGFLTITKDLFIKEKFVSSVPLVSGEIAEDFTYYFALSEQVPTSLGASVLLNTDGTVLKTYAYILQLLPFTTNEVIDKVESLINNMTSIANFIEEGKDIKAIISYLASDTESIIGEIPVQFHCPCTYDHFLNSLSVLSQEDLLELANDEVTKIKCHRCSSTYEVNSKDILKILEERTNEPR